MLKIAVISDTHLGFAYGTPRGSDALENCKQAFQKALDEKVDLILIPGDIFHEKIPRQEILGEAIELFSSIKKHFKNPKLIASKTKDGDKKENKIISPIITIYGTHERRHSDSTNPVHLLEKAGLVYNLHAESILIELKGDQVGIHGLSGVPETYAKQSLSVWNPEPFKNRPNILMLHQNFKELIPELETGYMELSDLPQGFDVFLLGHIHWNMEFKHPATNAPILVPGSTVKTQLTQKEAEKEKGIYILTVGREKGDINFIPLQTRPLYYHKIEIKKDKPVDVLKKVSAQIKKDIKSSKTVPLIRIKIRGTLHEKYSLIDLNLKKLIDEYKNKAIISIDKSKLQSSGLTKNSQLLIDLKENKISIEELGIKILYESLKTKIPLKDVESLFNFLADQDINKAEEILNSQETEQTNKLEEIKQIKMDEIKSKKQGPVTLEHF